MNEAMQAEFMENQQTAIQRADTRALENTISSALEAQVRARIEARYALAFNRPRDWDRARLSLLKECKRPRFAEVARYSKPQGRTPVTGPSIRFVEAALRCIGNIATETTVTLDDDSRRVIRVEVTDLETNVTHPKEIVVSKEVERRSPEGREVLRRRQNKEGHVLYIVKATDDEIMLKESSMISKALRQLGLRIIPGDLVDEAMDEVRATQDKEDKTDPEAARKRIFDGFLSLGIGPDQLKKYLGRDVTPLDIKPLRELYTGIRQGEVDWQELMAEKDEPKSLKTAISEKKAAKAAEAKPAATPEQIAEVGRLREKLENLNPLAAQMGKDAPNTQDAYAALIGQLQAEVNKAEGK